MEKKLFFSNKNNHGTNIKLVEGDKILKEDEKIVEELIIFFQNYVFNLQENSFIQSKDYYSLLDSVQRAIGFECSEN